MYRHGEIFIKPVSKLIKGKKSQHTQFIVGHSETGHHHVLESEAKFEIIEGEKEELYFRLFEPAKIVHKKEVDKHNTLTIAPGKYKVIKKKEFDPFDQVIREVHD